MKQFSIPTTPKVLIIGSGAREHAIAWKLAQSQSAPVLIAAPGNPGMAEICRCVDIPAGDVDAVVAFAVEEQVDLVVVGPELPLSLGLVDACRAQGIRAFGPEREAAMLETSKAFAKDVMKRAQVPTAAFSTFADADAAKSFIQEHGAPVVIKADGLAAGKGVTVALTVEEANRAVEDALVGQRFGQAGRSVVIESYLEGDEVSLMYFVDADSVVPMVSARDHKRAFDNNEGPNTGGMGAFAPVRSFATGGWEAVVTKEIVQPTLRELRTQGITYRGVLYVGLMMTSLGPQVIEFNARFGDPETEVVLPLLKSDLLEVMWAVAEDQLRTLDVSWHDGAAVCVVMAAAGYPDAPRVGDAIQMGNVSDGYVFHAGTRKVGGELTSAGGRVLTVMGSGTSLAEARSIAYSVTEAIYFDGKHIRTDIARTADDTFGSGRKA